MKITNLKIRNGYKISIIKWEIDNPIGVIQLVHGSLEHCSRYNELALFFNKLGFSVIGSDHRGHGQTAKNNDEIFGHVGQNNNHKTIITDLMEVNLYIRKNNKKIPIVLFGHSWGSYLARCLIAIKQADFQGAIISGTGWESPILTSFALMFLKIQKLFAFGNDSKVSHLLHQLTFKKFNKPFATAESTGLEWVSNDKEEQLKFFNDELRGECFSIAGFKTLIGTAKQACSKKTIERTNSQLPILIISGTQDPVGGFGKGVLKLKRKLKKQRCQFITTKLYIDQRHEIHLDTNKKEYFQDLKKWLKKYIIK